MVVRICTLIIGITQQEEEEIGSNVRREAYVVKDAELRVRIVCRAVMRAMRGKRKENAATDATFCHLVEEVYGKATEFVSAAERLLDGVTGAARRPPAHRRGGRRSRRRPPGWKPARPPMSTFFCGQIHAAPNCNVHDITETVA
jgi:hypothetical protein